MDVQDIEVTSRAQDDVWFEVRSDAPETASIHLGEEVDFRPLGTDHYRIAYVMDGLSVMVAEPAHVDRAGLLDQDTCGGAADVWWCR
jgi:hypothetical protein